MMASDASDPCVVRAPDAVISTEISQNTAGTHMSYNMAAGGCGAILKHDFPALWREKTSILFMAAGLIN